MRNPKVIVITGATSGLGAALAKVYAQQEVVLYLTGRNINRLSQISDRCRAQGAKVHARPLDVTDTQNMQQWLTSIDKDQVVDLVIANAGVSAGSLGGEQADQVTSILDVNVQGVINTIHPFIDTMVKRGAGQLVIIGSMAGLLPLPSSPAYSASKAAVNNYAKSLRGVLHSKQVGVTLVMPGYIDTPMTQVNQFPMPCMVKADVMAQVIKEKLQNNPACIAYPRMFYYVVRFLSSLPFVILEPFLRKLPGKPNFNLIYNSSESKHHES